MPVQKLRTIHQRPSQVLQALSPLDDFETHVQDTLTAGDGLCDESAVRAIHGTKIDAAERSGE